MNMNVLVPGAGGPAGISTIKSLRLGNFKGNIISTDSDPLSAGFYLSDFYSVIPKANDEFFLEELIKIINKYEVKVLLPSSGFDIYQYSTHYKILSELDVRPIVSRKEVMEICKDKLLSYKKLYDKFPFAYSTLSYDDIHKFPLIAKPRFGKGSKNIFKIDDISDLEYVTSKYKDMIFQEYLPGIEYSVDVLSDLDENPLLAVSRRRLHTESGISVKGKIEKNIFIENLCKNVAKDIGIRGPCLIQLKQSESGELKIIEINPRLGGGTFFTTLAGANFPSMILEMVLNHKISIPKISEITILRYYEEVIID